MKVKEVPQDGKQSIGKTTLMNYAVDDNGKIVPVPSSGWDVQVLVVNNLANMFDEWAAEAKERVKSGQSSPIEFFMYHFGLDLATLAQQIGFSKRKVKKHMTPKGFDRIDDTTLAKYASIFQIDVNDIKNFKNKL